MLLWVLSLMFVIITKLGFLIRRKQETLTDMEAPQPHSRSLDKDEQIQVSRQL